MLFLPSQTREELRNSLEDEIRGFNVDKDLSSNFVISWNHQEYEVQYQSLADEIKIGEYEVWYQSLADEIRLVTDSCVNDQYVVSVTGI